MHFSRSSGRLLHFMEKWRVSSLKDFPQYGHCASHPTKNSLYLWDLEPQPMQLGSPSLLDSAIASLIFARRCSETAATFGVVFVCFVYFFDFKPGFGFFAGLFWPLFVNFGLMFEYDATDLFW